MGRCILPILIFKKMDRLDYYDILPTGMSAYLSHYGWHFSRNMCKWAVGGMVTREDDERGEKKKQDVKTLEFIDNLLSTYGVRLKNDKGYDKVFVYHMGVSDYLGSSVQNQEGLAKYIKDVLDDPDGYEGIAFTRFFADCSAKGIPINWEDMI